MTLLRKLNVAVTGSGLRAWLRGRYAWLPAAVRYEAPKTFPSGEGGPPPGGSEEGHYERELCVFINRSRPERPSSVRANALPAPPEGKLK